MGKIWYKSRTVGLGGSLVILGLAILQLPELQVVVEQLPIEYQGIAILAIGVAMVILRHLTTEPLSTNKKAVKTRQDAS